MHSCNHQPDAFPSQYPPNPALKTNNHYSDLSHPVLAMPDLDLHINEIKQYISFCDWLLSFSIMSVIFFHVNSYVNYQLALFHCSVASHCMNMSRFYLSTLLLMDIWVISRLGLEHKVLFENQTTEHSIRPAFCPFSAF